MPRTARALVTLAAAVMLVVLGSPALAHGEDGESDPVDAVEQALAILVNTPDAADEALERIEDALAGEREEPSGELNVAALEAAGTVLGEGRLHDAEDALVEASARTPIRKRPHRRSR